MPLAYSFVLCEGTHWCLVQIKQIIEEFVAFTTEPITTEQYAKLITADDHYYSSGSTPV